MKSYFVFSIFLLYLTHIKQCYGIWCYRCTSATPGCAEKFNWRGIGYLGDPCPNPDDICIKITERKDASVTIIRDCLSSVQAFRTDIPPDHYEGCRRSAKDVRLAHYVFNNSISQLDIRRDHFDFVEYCFCFLDHRCNSSTALEISGKLLLGMIAMTFAALKVLEI